MWGFLFFLGGEIKIEMSYIWCLRNTKSSFFFFVIKKTYFAQFISEKLRVSEWLLFNASNFSDISWREQINFQWDDDEVRFVLDQRWVFTVLAHWKNSPRVDMSLYSDTLFWFRANQSLLFLLNAACLAEK